MLATLIVINVTGRQTLYTFRRIRAARELAVKIASLLEQRFPEMIVYTNRTKIIRAWVEAADSPRLLVNLLEFLMDERGWGRFAVGVAIVPVEWDPRAGRWDSPEARNAVWACGHAVWARVPVRFRGFGDERDLAASSVANVALWIRSRWSPATRGLIERADNAETLRSLASELGISPSALSGRLSRAGWRPYRYAWENCVTLLQEGVSFRRRRTSLPAALRGSEPTNRTWEGTL